MKKNIVINKNILIDTNLIYLIIGYNENKKIDIQYLTSLISKNHIVILIDSVFEMLNNQKFAENIKEHYNKLWNICPNLSFSSRTDIDKYFQAENLSNFEKLNEEQINNARTSLAEYYIQYYAYDISFTVILAFLPYIDFVLKLKPFIKNINQYDKCQKYIQNITIDLKKHLKNLLINDFRQLSELKSLCEKEIKKIFKNYALNLINDYIPYLNRFINNLNNENLQSYSLILQDLKKWYNNINLKNLFNLEKFDHIDIDNINIYKKICPEKKDFCKALLDDIMLNVTVKSNSYDYEKKYIENSIQCIFNGSFGLKSNNIMDQHIVDTFMNAPNINYYLTIDENQIKILRHSNEIKIVKSLEVIDYIFKK